MKKHPTNWEKTIEGAVSRKLARADDQAVQVQKWDAGEVTSLRGLTEALGFRDPQTTYKWYTRIGKLQGLKAVRIGPRSLRWRVADIKAFVEDCTEDEVRG